MPAAEKRGQELLERAKAHVLIWGEFFDDKNVIELYFLPRDHRSATAEAASYRLDQRLRLPKDFGTDLGPAIAAVAISAAAPAADDTGNYIVPELRNVAARLEPFVRRPPEPWTGDIKASVFHAYALAMATIGEQAGDSEALEEAVAAFREALKERAREHMPLQWAMAQNNLGATLRNLGERESSTERLEEAVAAYRQALKEYTRERVPLDWAMTQNNLGAALSNLGMRESGTEQLEEAVAAFRQALKERAHERAPLQWATTQNNLGTALANLGMRESGTERLEEATAAFRDALSVFEEAKASRYVEGTRKNLARVEALLKKRREE